MDQSARDQARDQAYNNYCKGFHMAVTLRLHAMYSFNCVLLS